MLCNIGLTDDSTQWWAMACNTYEEGGMKSDSLFWKEESTKGKRWAKFQQWWWEVCGRSSKAKSSPARLKLAEPFPPANVKEQRNSSGAEGAGSADCGESMGGRGRCAKLCMGHSRSDRQHTRDNEGHRVWKEPAGQKGKLF